MNKNVNGIILKVLNKIREIDEKNILNNCQFLHKNSSIREIITTIRPIGFNNLILLSLRRILNKPMIIPGREGRIVRFQNEEINFIRGNKLISVIKNKSRLSYKNYEDWKLVQSRKGKKKWLKKHWEATKEKQIRNWNFGEIKKGDKILEVGFRDGYNLKYLEKKGIDIEGIEVNSEAVMAAVELGCKAFEEDIQFKTHYDDEIFDIISACDVLEHCFSPENALNEIERILKKDGKVILEIPFEKKFSLNLLHGHSALFYNIKKFKSLVDSLGFRISKEDTSVPRRNLILLKKKISVLNQAQPLFK